MESSCVQKTESRTWTCVELSMSIPSALHGWEVAGGWASRPGSAGAPVAVSLVTTKW